MCLSFVAGYKSAHHLHCLLHFFFFEGLYLFYLQVCGRPTETPGVQQRKVWPSDTEAREGTCGARDVAPALSEPLRPNQAYCGQIFRPANPGTIFLFFPNKTIFFSIFSVFFQYTIYYLYIFFTAYNINSSTSKLLVDKFFDQQTQVQYFYFFK